jgi:hypothetical protein
MRARLIAFASLLAACLPADSSVDAEQSAGAAAVGNDCKTAQPANPLTLCFAGVDYVGSTPAAIYRVQPDGTAAMLFRRSAGYLTSYAQAPDGTVYFTNAVNGTAVYKVHGAGESVVYQHDTYVRMVRVDSKGNVYFNEDTGAGGDGTIYQLVDGAASPADGGPSASAAKVFYRVKLSTVGGFWGDFGFDGQDRLWLSSSNRIPSDLYLVVDGVPQHVYTSRDTSFMGFRFITPTQVLFAGQDTTLRVLNLCSRTLSAVYHVSGTLQAQDVNVCPTF